MRPSTHRRTSSKRTSRRSSQKVRKSSKSPNYHTISGNIPLKRKRTPTRSRNKKTLSKSRKRNTSSDSFELVKSSEKNLKRIQKREKFQIISNHVEIDEDMILEFKNRTGRFKTDYLIFGIIGTQSTGKSTLLNNVFNCEFDMLDAKKGRKQTTKGIWGSFIDESQLLILDIEGSDSMERTLKDQNAENKICTFGLIMTHVLFSKDAGKGLLVIKNIREFLTESQCVVFRRGSVSKTKHANSSKHHQYPNQMLSKRRHQEVHFLFERLRRRPRKSGGLGVDHQGKHGRDLGADQETRKRDAVEGCVFNRSVSLQVL